RAARNLRAGAGHGSRLRGASRRAIAVDLALRFVPAGTRSASPRADEGLRNARAYRRRFGGGSNRDLLRPPLCLDAYARLYLGDELREQIDRFSTADFRRGGCDGYLPSF